MTGNSLSEPLATYQEWRISKVGYQFEQKDHLDGPIFEFRDANWFLRIYPRGRMSDGKISLYLYREGFESEHVFLRIGMEKVNGTPFKDFEKRHTFTVGSNNCGHDSFLVYRHFLKYSCSILYDEVDTLTIFCIIRVADEPPSTNYKSRTPESEGTVSPTENHEEMNIESDKIAIMSVNGKEFRANSKLLIKRSKFFARKLKNSDTWTLEFDLPIAIHGCDPDTFDQFLQFLNDSNINIVTSNNMMGLYKNSSVWEIPELKAECIRRMKLELSVDTFRDIHNLSIVENETDLLNSVEQFFISNIKSILESDKWQEYLKSNHVRCNELFFKFLRSYSIN